MSPIGSASEILTIISDQQLNTVFQPIVDLRNVSLFGYEALTRGPADSALHSPINLFESAGRHGLMSALEYACRELACSRFVRYGAEGKLFLNVSPMSLLEPEYQRGMTHRILDRIGLPAERIVIELSEQYPLDDYVLMRDATDHFRAHGFQIAIDDLGAGYAGLRAWSELRPDYVKVDRHFIERVDADPVKREFLRSILEIAKELDCQVVAEGIETVEQLMTVQSLGIPFGQGYFIGRPEQVPAAAGRVLGHLSKLAAPQPRRHSRTERVGDLAINTPVIEPWCSLDDAVELLRDNRQLSCLPVVESGRPLGLLTRQELLELYAARFTRELHGKKSVRQFLSGEALIVAESCSLEEVSRLLTADGDRPLSQDFIITRNGQFYGIGRTSTLLRRITEQQIRNARYANPLTMLPGSVPIHEMLEELLQRAEPFHVAYCDLDAFKPFNDYYGYSRGDEVILFLAQLLQDEMDPEHDFVGHIGGDDFMLVLRSGDWQSRCEAVLQRFEAGIRRFYSDEELREGGLRARSRNGEECFFPLITLSIGVAHPDSTHCFSYHDVAALATDAKREAKRLVGNTLFVSRRRRPVPLQAELELRA
jgi:diguanylate cyclase (GGDEF)-like protein